MDPSGHDRHNIYMFMDTMWHGEDLTMVVLLK